jgi:parvulin-like peptidyl-prolyl isomerase
MRQILILIMLVSLSACGAKVAKVNGDKILASDFESRLKLAATQADAAWLKQPARAQAFKEKILNAMINEELLLQEANRLDITASDEELAEEYARYKSQYTEAAFQKMLKDKAISYDDWKEERRRNYIIEKLRNTVTPDAKKITDTELKAFYDQNMKDFQRPEEVRVRQILVGKLDTAKMIYAKLKEGDNFAALAQQYSISPDAKNGGDVGYFSRGTFPAIFDKICFSLPVGAVSDVVKSEFGYQIFKVTDHRPARTIPFAEAKKMILRSLKHAGGEKAFDDLLLQLRQNAKISIDDRNLSKIEVPHETIDPDTDAH